MDGGPRIFSTAPLRGPGLEKLQALGEVVVDPWIEHVPFRLYSAEKLAERAKAERADVLVVEADECKGPVLDLPLRAIASTRGDPNNVDLATATERGIPVLHAPGRNADGVAEMTVALLLAVNRHVLPADDDVRAGQVFKNGTLPYQRYRAWQVAGRTAGIVGLGAVGRATKWRLEGLGMKVVAHDPYNPEATHSLDQLLEESDVVSMHATVTPETEELMGTAQFEAMRDGAVYLNTARAKLHDLDALTKALESGKLAGAGLDHFEGEMLPPDHPLIRMTNVVLTPHVGGATYDTEVNHSRLVADGLEAVLDGRRPDNLANPEVWRD